MKKKEYQWRIESLAKGVDPTIAVKEITKIEKSAGAITPETVLDAAKNKRSPLHALFTWDNSEAAHQFRLQQARTLLNNIQVTIIHDGNPKVISVYEVITNNDSRSYKHIESFTPDDIHQVKMRTIAELNTLKTKLGIYNEFHHVVKVLEETVRMVQDVGNPKKKFDDDFLSKEVQSAIIINRARR
jgi:hypothetical protein